MVKRIISVLLIACMLITAVPFSALASVFDPEFVGSGETVDLPEEETEWESLYTSAASPSNYENFEFTTDAILAMVKEKLLSLAKSGAGAAGKWTAGKFLELIFPESATSDVERIQMMLSQVLENQAVMMEQMQGISEKITATAYSERLTEYKKMAQTGLDVRNAWATLQTIDRLECTEEAREKKRKNAVTVGIGISGKTLRSGVTELDRYVDRLAKLISEPYDTVTVSGGHEDYNLAQLHYDYTRLNDKYLFEHEAYDDLISFQAYAYGNFMEAACVQMLSLQARLEHCQEKGYDCESINTAVELLTEDIDAVQKALDTVKIDRDQDTYSYFWVPGYEVKMYRQTELHLKPRETYWSDVHQRNDLGDNWCNSLGFAGQDINNAHNKAFWDKFWTYGQTNQVNCLSGEQYKKIYEGVRHRDATRLSEAQNLYALLFDTGKLKKYSFEYEGNTYVTEETDKYLLRSADSYKIRKSGDHIYASCLQNKKFSDKNYFKKEDINLGQYTKYMGMYLAYQDRNLENNRYILIAEYPEQKEGSKSNVAETNGEPENTNPYAAYHEDGSYAGCWTEENLEWLVKTASGCLKDRWAKLSWNGKHYWYYFGSDGYMDTGWMNDRDGRTYYLCPETGKNKGAMLTGWQKIGELWYYFSTKTEALKEGQSKETQILEGQLLKNTVTPDGYKVGADGAWIR